MDVKEDKPGLAGANGLQGRGNVGRNVHLKAVRLEFRGSSLTDDRVIINHQKLGLRIGCRRSAWHGPQEIQTGARNQIRGELGARGRRVHKGCCHIVLHLFGRRIPQGRAADKRGQS